MKALFFLTLALCSLQASAATIRQTSFYFIRNGLWIAELCGKVDGAAGVSQVNAVIDPRTSRPGHYNTITNQDGKFCILVNTSSGEAELRLMGQTEVAKFKVD